MEVIHSREHFSVKVYEDILPKFFTRTICGGRFIDPIMDWIKQHEHFLADWTGSMAYDEPPYIQVTFYKPGVAQEFIAFLEEMKKTRL